MYLDIETIRRLDAIRMKYRIDKTKKLVHQTQRKAYRNELIKIQQDLENQLIGVRKMQLIVGYPRRSKQDDAALIKIHQVAKKVLH